MHQIEYNIIQILKLGTPLRAVEIAHKLGVERREINHYLYSSLKDKVIQDSDYRWSLKTYQASNNRPPSVQKQPQSTQSSIQAKPNKPYELIRRELEQASSKEKIKILDNAFKHDRFTELKDEQINALFSILEQAKYEVRIAEEAHRQGRLSSQKNNPLVIAAVSIVLTLSALFAVIQLKSNSTHQSTPTIQESR